MELHPVLENAFYLLALLNPASKIMFLASYEPELSAKQNFELAWKSSLAALVILCLMAAAGHILLSRIFRVELYSLRITGGLVVFLIGWTAIREGHFIQKRANEMRQDFTDISLVPLAAPLIAGPGMIAAVIAGSVQSGLSLSIAALMIAIGINFLLMIFARFINDTLNKLHLLGPLIRLTGLIIAAVAMQMILSGFTELFVSHFPKNPQL